MREKSILFFRNDDVRDTLDSSLVKITELFIQHNIPITHAVEPANISPGVIKWLIETKQKSPDLIEIMQHGYDHQIKNSQKKGEFGGQRTYSEQYHEISMGKELMNQYFGDLWFQAFNFPFAPYNAAAIKALNDCGFKVLNSHFNRKSSRQIFYFFGHLLNKGYWFDHHVSWNLNRYPNTNLFEIDMNISFIKKYLNDKTECEMESLENLKKETLRYAKYKTVGLLLHHRYHNSDAKINLVDDYLKWVKEQDFKFLNMEKIYGKFCLDGK